MSKTKTPVFNRRRYVPSRKVCSFCAGKIETIDYKDFEKLRGFISDRAKISPRRRTGTCAKHQRVLATAIKRARHLALLPYVPLHTQRVGSFGIRG
ncbi:30S ribosomal protein S18 [Chloroflexota bacterium]